jgi:DNA-binding MarR family transcriptional regulator
LSTPSRKPGPKRADLLKALQMAAREATTATVLFHFAIGERFGMSGSDARALDILDRFGPLSAGEIAEKTGLATPSVTSLIDRLEEKGRVRRVRDPKDRRRVIVELHKHLEDFGQFYMAFGERMQALFSRYTDDELEFIRDFLKLQAEKIREETQRLTQGKDAPRPKRPS